VTARVIGIVVAAETEIVEVVLQIGGGRCRLEMLYVAVEAIFDNGWVAVGKGQLAVTFRARQADGGILALFRRNGDGRPAADGNEKGEKQCGRSF